MKTGSLWALALLSIAFAAGLSAQVQLTRNTDPFTITQGNGVACTNTATLAIVENHFWRVYDLSTMLPNTAFRVEAIRVAFEVSDTAPNTYHIRVYDQQGAAFPGGTRTQVGATQTITETV